MKKVKIDFNTEELNDIWSALAFFIREYPKDGSEITKREMQKIIKKVRKGLKEAK